MLIVERFQLFGRHRWRLLAEDGTVRAESGDGYATQDESDAELNALLADIRQGFDVVMP